VSTTIVSSIRSDQSTTTATLDPSRPRSTTTSACIPYLVLFSAVAFSPRLVPVVISFSERLRLYLTPFPCAGPGETRNCWCPSEHVRTEEVQFQSDPFFNLITFSFQTRSSMLYRLGSRTNLGRRCAGLFELISRLFWALSPDNSLN